MCVGRDPLLAFPPAVGGLPGYSLDDNFGALKKLAGLRHLVPGQSLEERQVGVEGSQRSIEQTTQT